MGFWGRNLGGTGEPVVIKSMIFLIETITIAIKDSQRKKINSADLILSSQEPECFSQVIRNIPGNHGFHGIFLCRFIPGQAMQVNAQ